MDNKVYFAVKDELNRIVPGCEYRNGCIAAGFAKGKKDKLDEDRIRRMLLQDIEDGFITYGQAVALRDIYLKAIEDLKKVY